MGAASASNTIQARFAALWTGTPLSRVAWPNSEFTPPSPDKVNPTASTWVRLTIRDFAAEQLGLHTTAERQAGAVAVQVFAPKGVGAGLARQLGDSVAAIFRRVTAGALTFKTPTISESPEPAESAWYGVLVVCPFYREE